MDNVDKFGERLREKRTAKGWTQLELAKRMDIAPMDVSNYERGAKKPRNERALLLAQVLGVSSAWLVFGVGEP
jgi:transcriptional regulator with XRE-family HTH domain